MLFLKAAVETVDTKKGSAPLFTSRLLSAFTRHPEFFSPLADIQLPKPNAQAGRVEFPESWPGLTRSG